LKPAPFDYAKPNSVEEVFDLLDRYGDDARLLAGGQSLLPSLNMRLSAPAILIDISGQDALRGIVIDDGVLRIGALTTFAGAQGLGGGCTCRTDAQPGNTLDCAPRDPQPWDSWWQPRPCRSGGGTAGLHARARCPTGNRG
jgi:hypothetical protein